MRRFSRSIIAALILAAFGAVGLEAQANQTYTQRWFFASDFGQWAVRGQQANTYQWSPGTVCNVTATGTQSNSFFAFATNAPIEIVDTTGPITNNEMLTPSAVTANNSYCSISVSPTYNHYSFDIISGTAGLQENLNQISSSNAYPATIFLDRNWYTLANAIPHTTPAGIIAAAQGNAKAILVDVTSDPWAFYVWNGTKYVASAGNTAGNQQATVLATAGSGTSPTISTYGAGSTQVVNLTPAATTGTGTIFSLTYNNVTGGVISGTYTSGLSVTGATGSQVCLTASNNSSTATALLTLTGTNAIAGGTALNVYNAGSGATAPPTTATVALTGCGITTPATTASGTATISTVLGNSGGYIYTPVCTVQSIGVNAPAGTLSIAPVLSGTKVTATVSIASTALTATTPYQFRINCQ